MPAERAPLVREIVLVGGGHSHLGALRCLGRQPLPGVRLTLISMDSHAPYSGMLPGYVAGRYRYEQTVIDLRRLARFAGARCYVDEVVGIDRNDRLVLCRNRPPVSYDILSINTGSTPQTGAVVGGAEHALPVKPIHRFNERWLRLLDRVRRRPAVTTVAVVGAGASGVEMILAIQQRLRSELRALGRNPDDLTFHLFSASPEILPRHGAGVRRRFDRILADRGVIVHRGAVVTRVSPGELGTGSGESLATDEVIWLTQAGGAPWFGNCALSLDGSGFIKVRSTLQTVSDPQIFAAGDCAALVAWPLEKAGVFAVRQGEVLAANLRRLVFGQPLQDYRPQSRSLALIGTGDGQAVASRGPIHARGQWVWRWKSWIDRRFVDRFAIPGVDSDPAHLGGPAAGRDDVRAREARGLLAHRSLPAGWAVCASSDLAFDALRSRPGGKADLRASGLPDSGTHSEEQTGRRMRTVDFLASPVDDPWLFGRMAATHALSEFFATGGDPRAARLVAVVPQEGEGKVAEDVAAMSLGVARELQAAGCELSGVRAVAGNEFAVILVVDGWLPALGRSGPTPAGIRPGDVLIVNKPIGIGTLLAADRRLRVPGRHVDEALRLLVESNRDAASCFREHGATACIRLEGLGLQEQLTELVARAGLAFEIDAWAVPVADGAATVLALLPDRGFPRATHQACSDRDGHCSEPVGGSVEARMLREGLTAGGLLAFVPPSRAEACLRALRELGYRSAALVGRVLATGGQGPPPVGESR